MSDFAELAAAIERAEDLEVASGEDGWAMDVIVRDVPLLIERAERAESALERAREDRDSHDRARRYEMGRRDRAEAELYRLAEALLNYGECKGWCESGYGPGRACTCGWVLLARESVGEVHALYAEVAALTAERDRLAKALEQVAMLAAESHAVMHGSAVSRVGRLLGRRPSMPLIVALAANARIEMAARDALAGEEQT